MTFSLYTFQEKDTHQLNVQKQGVIKLRSPILLDVTIRIICIRSSLS